MDYKKLYYTLMKYCKETTIKERLISRNNTDDRINKGYIYKEKHHIIPKSLGGNNTEANLVILLPEEHLIAHRLRYKAFNKKQDYLAIRFMLNSFKNNSFKLSYNNSKVNKSIKKNYIYFRQNIAEFRKNNGWQTEDGRKRISESMKNKIVVIDKINREIIGKVNCNHPKVLSGEWIHHSSGTVIVSNIDGTYIRVPVKDKYKYLPGLDKTGQKNSRFIKITEEEIIEEYLKFSKELGFICSYQIFSQYSKRLDWLKDCPIISNSKNKKSFRFGGDLKIIEKLIKEKCSLPYLNSRYYSPEIKKQYFNNQKIKEYIKEKFKC